MRVEYFALRHRRRRRGGEVERRGRDERERGGHLGCAGDEWRGRVDRAETQRICYESDGTARDKGETVVGG